MTAGRRRRFVPSGDYLSGNLLEDRFIGFGPAFLAFVLLTLSGGFHRTGTYRTDGIGDLDEFLLDGDDMNLLDVERTGLISEFTQYLNFITGMQPIQSIAEFLGRLVCSACDLSEHRIDIDEDMPPGYMTGIGRNGPFDGI